MTSVLARISFVVSLAFAPSALAAGLWNFDQGAANYARGGANIAAPNDPTAVYLNPAALAGQPGYTIYGQADFLFDERKFERKSDRLGHPRYCCRDTEYDAVTNSQPPFPPSPGVYASGHLAKLGLPQLTMALALYGPPRNDGVYPAGGPQLYSLVKNRNLQTHAALAAGYELPWKRTRVGLTAMVINQYVDTDLALNSFFGEDEERTWDADASVKARQENIPNAIVGVSSNVVAGLTVAASYQHSYDVKAKGSATGEIGEDLDELAYFRPGTLGVELKMPAIARGALRWDAARWNVEGAFVYENWSRNKEVIFAPKQPGGIALILDDDSLRFPVNELAIPTHFRDTWSVRTGGEFFAIPGKLAIRGGLFNERAAIAPEWLNVGNFDLDKTGISAGARYDFGNRGWLEIGGGYQQWGTVEVENSRVRIIDPLQNEEKWQIGNGTYSNTRIVVMTAAAVRFGVP